MQQQRVLIVYSKLALYILSAELLNEMSEEIR